MAHMSTSPALQPETAAPPPDAARPGIGLRLAFLSLGAIALMAGFYGALARLGWVLPGGARLAELHGPLMISGLFGTFISLERAVALSWGWSYVAPALTGLGTLALLAGVPVVLGAGLYAAAAAVLVGASLVIMIQQPAVFTSALLFAALAWLAGNVLWLMGGSVPDLVGWWLTFLVLTIAGERLELSRLLPRRRGGVALFLFAVGLFLAGAQNGLPTQNGAVLYGLALLAVTVWLARHDIAWLNIRRNGQTRFMAVCILAGYAWLGLAGASLMIWPPGAKAFGYDVALHAVLIGFVLSMVFGHALIIVPAIARARIRYHRGLYAPLLLLHASVALRMGAGLTGWDAGRRGSGLLTLLALAGFVACLVGDAGGRALRTEPSQAGQSHDD